MVARVPNPYRPGFNQAPLALAGRETVMAGIDEALDVAALDGRTPRPLVLTGSRGVGKTVVLGEAAAHAAVRHSWLTVPVEVRPETPFIPQLIERLTAARELYQQSPAGKHVTVTAAKVRASVLGVGGEVEIQRRGASAQEPALPLDAALAAACQAAMEHGAGLVITVDELQLASRTGLGDLAATLQEHVPDGWPLVVIVAGLPSIRSTHRGVTYFERAEWHVLGMLDRTAAEVALQAPARDAGRPMADSAARILAEASGGYPYAIQLIGHHAWRASTGSTSIEKRHTAAAITAAQDELAGGLYAARWGDASPREKEYLRALARLCADRDQVTGAMVAGALGRTSKALSAVRERLIQKGAIYAEAEVVRFAVPGMAAWVQQEDPG
jgi:hypothetical protein